MEKFYRNVRQQLGLEKEELKREVKQEAVEELKLEFEQEISYIEAQMREYEQLVAEVNHLMAKMRRKGLVQNNSSEKKDIKMKGFDNDIEPLRSKLRKLEESMQERLDEQKAYS